MRDSTLYIGALASNNVNNIVNDTSKYDEYKEKAQMFDTKYQKTAVSIMEQAKEKFLVAFKSINYKQGTATSILSDIMKKC